MAADWLIVRFHFRQVPVSNLDPDIGNKMGVQYFSSLLFETP
jgi:hypothetical protein